MENYPYIPVQTGEKAVRNRMRAGRADFSASLEKDFGAALQTARRMFHPRGKAGVFDVERAAGALAVAGNEVRSEKLYKLMESSSAAYLMCASIPADEVQAITDAMKRGEGLLALVLDAYASECVDGALDVMMQRKNEMLRRTGQRLTRHRFSAGYGDLGISVQKLFFDLLDAQTLGITINDKFMLAPEKSVIAIAGVI